MDKLYYYRAFSCNIESCFPLLQLPQIQPCKADVRVVRADLSDIRDRQECAGNHVFFRGKGQGSFLVTNGNLIQVDPMEGYIPSYLSIFIMGSGMGAILIQRGFMLLHGSCVTDGCHAVLITGDSGAGKSTIAAEFLRHGWKLVTDDVTAVFDVEHTPKIQSSYPSQKLWKDALDRYEICNSNVHSLYFSEDREKFGVNVSDSFFEGTCPLSLVVRLVPADQPCSVEQIQGITMVDQLLRNSYRSNFIAPEDRQRHFQRCVTLSSKIPMALAVRENGKQCADIMYKLITEFMEEHCHD